MTDQELTACKFIILYILRKIDFSMTFSQLSGIVLVNEYSDYFTLQMALGELTDADLIHQEMIQDVIYYAITPEGEETLGYFENRIDTSIRCAVDQYLKENSIRMRDESSVLADYYKITSGEYQVRCTVKEGKTNLIDLTLTVPGEPQAKAIASQWKVKCQNVYAYVMDELLQA